MSVSTAGQQPSSTAGAPEDPRSALYEFLEADPQLRGRTTVVPAPTSQSEPRRSDPRGSYELRREEELPALMRRLRGERETTKAPGAPGEPPTALATYREERRQICAISRIVCQVTTEVLQGLRPAHQLQRWLDPQVQQKVSERAALMAQARRAADRGASDRGTSRSAGPGGSAAAIMVPRPQPLTFGHLRAERVARGAWEVAVVFGDARRIRACALRLEAHRRRWRVVAMELG